MALHPNTVPQTRRARRLRSTKTSRRRVVATSLAAAALLASGGIASAATGEVAQASTETGVSLSTPPQFLQVARTEIPDYAEQIQRAAEREVQRVAFEKAEAERLAREAAEQAARQAAAEEAARRPAVLFPTDGTFTSGFGARWGTSHNGIDIANSIGTPIRAVTNGTVIETGPASGFGLWVRLQQDDGTIGVFGHIDQSLVSVGQQVRAGDQIATMGNRGQSTGPHLHYEVWTADGTKIDPAGWLRSRGVPVAQG
ncbi:M23 family metallopeptidase [Rhodococcus jostii]|uniref:Murein DD-endopeptidase MepM and murein hydrolase activator NlpD, contain LysM domain n=1 Tax=Rhodococcus jostii TaxID=132919 RepID=A0A1H4VWC3_RHOJO|nr:M23 family metallopeptidase [Rhodococcus jostii]SEC84574.1 Murein DD-endopeptidase MepM and murein hydrolase activator NlpD, contain LysM domain [Rhodococcus jostii]